MKYNLIHQRNYRSSTLSLCFITATIFALFLSSVPVKAIEAPPAAKDPLASQLAQKRKISPEEAQAKLKAQDKAPKLFDELHAKKLGNFGGMWIDNNDDRIKIGVVGNGAATDKAVMSESVKKFGLDTAVDYVPVSTSYHALERTAAELSSAIRELGKENFKGAMGVGIIPSRNVVYVDVPEAKSALTQAQVSFVEGLKSAYSASVITTYSTDHLEQNDDCGVNYCDAPLRGGVGIRRVVNDTAPCSSGFIVRGLATGNRYVLTAGHCSNGYTGAEWYSKEDVPSPPMRKIGPVTRNEFNNSVDAMIIRRDDYGWLWTTAGSIYMRDGISYDPTIIAPPSRDTQWDIAGYMSNSGLEGERVCATGRNGSSCGTVEAVNVNETLNGHFYTGLVRAKYCATLGDSGGAVVRGNYTHAAVGIHSLGVDHGPDMQDWCSNQEHYTGMTSIMSAFDNTFELVTW